MPSLPEVQNRFLYLDRRCFGGRLASGTRVEFMVTNGAIPLVDAEAGVTKKDGTLVLINPEAPADEWPATLAHEMVHAFEFRFGVEVEETEEGSQAHRAYGRSPLYGEHSAKFFSLLFRVIRDIGDDPHRDFGKYFG